MENDFGMLATQFLGIFHSTFGHITEQGLVGIGAGTFGNLKNHRALLLGRSLDDGLKLLHVVEVESRDGIAAVNGSLEHLAGVHQA